jgi:hypothetical protein
MRFLQPNKFSCFLRLITKSNIINESKNFALSYDRFLKSVLIENIIGVIFLMVVLSFMLNLKEDYTNFKDDNFSRNFLSQLTKTVSISNSDTYSFKILIKNMLGFLNDIHDNFDSNINKTKLEKMFFATLSLKFDKIGIKNPNKMRKVINRLKHASYYNDLGNFKFFLTQNPIEVMTNILKLNSFKYCINLKMLQFNFYYINLNESYLRISTVNIAIHPSSMKKIQMNSEIHDVNMTKRISDPKFVFLFVFMVLFAAYYLFDEIHAIILYKLEYFRHFLKIIDTLLVYFLVCLLIRKILSLYLFNNLKSSFEELKPSVSEVKFLLLNYANYFLFEISLISLNGIIVLLTWLKLSKFVNFTVGHTQMTATLCNSFHYLISYLLVCIAIFMSHSMILSRFFGQTNEEYSTFLLASFTLIRTLLGHINLHFFNANSSGFLRLIFFSYFFFVFVILLGIFLAIINESYSFVIENYENSPELNYFDFFLKRFSRVRDKIQLKFLHKQKTNNNQKLSITKLDSPIEARVLYDLLLKMDFDKVEINLLFEANGINLKYKSNLVQPNICKKIYSKLLFARNRIERLKCRKLSFFKAIWFQNSEHSVDVLPKSKSILSVANLSRKDSSKINASKSMCTLDKTEFITNEDFSVNDEINLEYNNFYSELTTWREFNLLKKRINEFNLKLQQISSEILEIYSKKSKQ